MLVRARGMRILRARVSRSGAKVKMYSGSITGLPNNRAIKVELFSEGKPERNEADDTRISVRA